LAMIGSPWTGELIFEIKLKEYKTEKKDNGN
jgi:hypothetical protein